MITGLLFAALTARSVIHFDLTQHGRAACISSPLLVNYIVMYTPTSACTLLRRRDEPNEGLYEVKICLRYFTPCIRSVSVSYCQVSANQAVSLILINIVMMSFYL